MASDDIEGSLCTLFQNMCTTVVSNLFFSFAFNLLLGNKIFLLMLNFMLARPVL